MAYLFKRRLTWWIGYRVAGREVRKSVGTDKRLAEQIKKDIEGRLVRQDYGLEVRDLAVKDALELFAEARAGKASKKWLKVQHARIQAFFAWGSIKRLEQATPPILEAYLAHRHKTESLTTAHNDRVILRNFFLWAERMGYIRQSPTRRISPLPTLPKRDIRFLSREEAAKLLIACTEPVPFHGRGKKGQGNARPRQTPLFELAIVAIFAGLRLGEIIHLRWQDIDYQRKTLHVRVTDTFTPKDKESRVIPLHPRLEEVLRAHAEARGNGTGYLFKTSSGEVFDRPNLLKELQLAASRAGIENVNWYTLRHTFASWLAMEGVSLHKIAKFLGHASITTTERHYAGLIPQDLHEDIEKL